MNFTDREIELARMLRDKGLEWQPAVGHFVYDEEGIIEVPSPFQERVYFILDLKHFLKRAGTVENLKSSMLWLPHWHQARQIATTQNISNERIAEELGATSAIESQKELEALYGLILQSLG